MKTTVKILFLLALNIKAMAQTDAYPTRKWTLEPAIGMRLSAAFGLVDIQVSCLSQYAINRRLSVASHTAFSFDLNTFKAFKNIDPKYSFTTFQKFGIGTALYTKRTSHSFFLLAGGKYFTYSGSIKNPKLEDRVQSKFNTFSFDKGLMYNLKIGRGSSYFSGRIYAPVFDGKWIALENAAAELGAGFHLKGKQP
jgi:hypothetical protein